MGIFDIFSKRKKREEEQNVSEMYQYTTLPTPFRAQVLHIFNECIGPYRTYSRSSFENTDNYMANHLWPKVRQILLKEHGLLQLSHGQTPQEECYDFLLKANTDEVLDLIEVAFRMMVFYHSELAGYQLKQSEIELSSKDAIEELNHRFREHKIGYQFVNNKIFKVNSEYIHEQAVIPAITLLHDNKFLGAEEEFMQAHDHFRQNNYKDAIHSAGKAFESVMKTICDLKGWGYDKNKATAAPLVQILFEKELIPNYLQSEFTSLSTLLKNGVPVVRNRIGGHGQGATPTQIPEYIATYALHMLAANIVFLVEAYKKIK